MTNKIKEICIKAFRGIPDLHLLLDGKSLIICGENGTGKSSIVDSIEFFFTGNVSHLSGVQKLSMSEHAPHTKFKPEDVEVDISFNPGDINLVRKFDTELSHPPVLNDFFKVTQRGTFILRRAQLLSFIISKPADRFRAIGDIIGIGDLDELELDMKSMHDNLKAEYEQRKKNLQTIIGDISDIIGEKISDDTELIEKFNSFTKKLNLKEIKDFQNIGDLKNEINKKLGPSSNLDKLKIITDVNNSIEEIKSLTLLKDSAINLDNDVNRFLANKIKDDLEIVEMLNIGNSLLMNNVFNNCPLCEQRIEQNELLEKISKRLVLLNSLSEESTKIRKGSTEFKSLLNKCIDNLISLKNRINKINELTKFEEKLTETISSLESLMEEVRYDREIKTIFPIDILNDTLLKLDLLIKEIIVGLKKVEDSLSSEELKYLDSIKSVEKVIYKLEEFQKLKGGLDSKYNQYITSEIFYNTFIETKKEKTQNVYELIQKDIDKFYLVLHESDPHKNIEIKVASSRRASTELTIESFGRKEQDPRALTSEGHLDSLGLCIFLALVKKFNENCSLIILDDVVSTIDSNHRSHICKLLFQEFKDKQFIITTHDKYWYKQLIDAQRAYCLGGDYINNSIVEWNIESGPKLKSYKIPFETITENISEGNLSAAGNMGRSYLEEVLKKISKSFFVKLPFTEDGNYSLGDLYSGVKLRIEELILDTDTSKKGILDAFRELECTSLMGNILSHDNILKEELSSSEVSSFCNAVKVIEDLFLCSNCGKPLVYVRDLKIVKCPNFSKCGSSIEITTK